MSASAALFSFNFALLGLAIVAEIVTVLKDRKRHSRFVWLGVLRVALLVVAGGIVIQLNSAGLIPAYNPMRIVLTLALLHITIRDVYDMVART